MPTISLLTDFGTRDHFVGAMKGVMLSYVRDATIVDITHDIPPHDIYFASLQLDLAYRYFPAGTVHCAVVDPGVGTDRKILAVETNRFWLVGPDNGIFSHVLKNEEGQVYSFDPRLFSSDLDSTTFHGRDIFAPLAARIARDHEFISHGTPLDKIFTLDVLSVDRTSDQIVAHVEWVDRYGNLITNASKRHLNGARPTAFNINGETFEDFHHHYSEANSEVFALWNSHGRLEIALNLGSASERLNAGFGTRVEIQLEEAQTESS